MNTNPYQSYLGASSSERDEMLREMNVNSPLEFFRDVPSSLVLENAPKLPLGPMTESEVLEYFLNLAKKNKNSQELVSFLGGGVRQIYFPAFLDELLRRGELYTSYTPYQAETSQGSLQLLFEYQSLIAEITGMDVANASMYDWATAIGEAALTTVRWTRKKRIVVLSPLRREKKDVLRNYLSPQGIQVEYATLPEDSTLVDLERIKDLVTPQTAGVYLEMPNSLGYLHTSPQAISEIIHDAGAKFIVGVDVLSLGLITPPGEYGADIVVGEGQPLGNPSSFGGPLLGVFAFNYDKKAIRQVPGKLVGITTEHNDGDRGFTITLQAREQHIRRAKATSNICSNEGLTAIASAIYLSSLGPQGFKELSEGLYQRAHYLSKKLQEVGLTAPNYNDPFFADFSVAFPVNDYHAFEKNMITKGFVPGKYFPDYQQSVLGVSELHTKENIDTFASVLKEVLS